LSKPLDRPAILRNEQSFAKPVAMLKWLSLKTKATLAAPISQTLN
jgi:hypothetical protein